MDRRASMSALLRSPDRTAGPLSPVAMQRSTVKSPGAVSTETRKNEANSKVLLLCDDGLELYNAGKYEEAEDRWKEALQISQTDVRTLLHYAVMVRDIHGDKERSDQLMQQAMGDWYIYSSLGLTEPAKDDELRGRPKIVSPKKDIQKMNHMLKQVRSNVEFYSLKNLQKKLLKLEHHHEKAEEGGGRDGGESEEHTEL